MVIFLQSFADAAWFSLLFMLYRVLDTQNERFLHVVPIPGTGGVAIIVAPNIGILYLLVINSLPRPMIIGCVVALFVSSVSFVDDIYRLRVVMPLVVQVLG